MEGAIKKFSNKLKEKSAVLLCMVQKQGAVAHTAFFLAVHAVANAKMKQTHIWADDPASYRNIIPSFKQARRFDSLTYASATNL